MSVRKIRDRWWVDFRHRFVRYRKKSPLNTKAGAEEYEAVLRGALGRGEDIDARPDPAPRPVTLAAFATEWFETYVKVNNKPSEVESKDGILRAHLLPALGAIALGEVDASAIERFKGAQLRAGLSPKTINNQLTVLNRCLKCAVEWSRLPHAPRVKWLRPMRPEIRFLRADEAERLAAVGVPMVVVALRTGLRVGELLGLRWRDVDLDARELTVARSIVRDVVGTPKSNRARRIPLSSDVVAALGAARARGRDDDPVFARADGRPLRRNQANWILGRACHAAGVVPIGWHGLRHTFASLALARTGQIRAVQDILGHSTVLMTERYAHVTPDLLRSVVDIAAAPRCPADLGQPAGTAAR